METKKEKSFSLEQLRLLKELQNEKESLERENSSLREIKIKLQADKRQLQKELNRVKTSLSYRIGRAVTFIPRKILGGRDYRKTYGTLSVKSGRAVEPYAFIRVKNESITIKASLNSILPVIKKGVIAYNDCTDGSDLFIQDFCKQNSGFIPFCYPYHVVEQNHPDYLTEKIPYQNTLAAYYNAALSFIPKNSWLIKIDCDQIYFPEILQKSFSLPKNNSEVVSYSRLDLIRYHNSVKVIEYKRPGDHWLIYNNNLEFINRYGYNKKGEPYAWELLVMPKEYKVLYLPECSSLHFPFEKNYRNIALEEDKLLSLEKFRKIADPEEISPEILEDRAIKRIISSFEYPKDEAIQSSVF